MHRPPVQPGDSSSAEYANGDYLYERYVIAVSSATHIIVDAADGDVLYMRAWDDYSKVFRVRSRGDLTPGRYVPPCRGNIIRFPDVLVVTRAPSPVATPTPGLVASVIWIAMQDQSTRTCSFSEAVEGCPYPALGDWRMHRARATLWLLRAVKDQGTTPETQHLWWVQTMGLRAPDPDVGEHDLLSEILEAALVYDQLTAGEVGVIELVPRRCQLLEEIHSCGLAAAENADSDLHGASHDCDGRSTFLGHPRDRSMILVAPELGDFVETTLKKRALVFEETGKAREENEAAGEKADEPERCRGKKGKRGAKDNGE